MIGDNKLRLLDMLSTIEDTAHYDIKLERLRFLIKESLESDKLDDDSYGFILIAINEILADYVGLDKGKTHISYAPLSGILAKYNLTITALCDAIGFSAGVRSSLVNNRPVNMAVLNKIAVLLNCGIDDMIEFISENEVRRRFSFGRLIKDSPKLIEAAIDGQYEPSYLDEDAKYNMPNGTQFNIRNFTMQFDNKNSGYDLLFRMLEVSEDDFKKSRGLENEL